MNNIEKLHSIWEFNKAKQLYDTMLKNNARFLLSENDRKEMEILRKRINLYYAQNKYQSHNTIGDSRNQLGPEAHAV